MKIINLPRCAGKTTEAVKMSARTKSPILCMNKSHCRIVQDRAEKLGIPIPAPISINELFDRSKPNKPDSIIIDEMDVVFQELLQHITGKTIHIEAGTLSDDENCKITRRNLTATCYVDEPTE